MGEGTRRTRSEATPVTSEPSRSVEVSAEIPCEVHGPDSGPPVSPFLNLAPGAILGRYVVIEALGRGGMGQVVLAYDTQLARNVAIKVLRPLFETDEGRLRMLREAQAMAQISHPNLVTIFDVGEHAGSLYLAMEYIRGETLQRWLATERPRRDVLSVMKQAGRGLAAAHAAGFVHRDFKPENVMIARDGGKVCVLDFGIARAATADAPPSSRPATSSRGASSPRPTPPSFQSTLAGEELTQEGDIVGTVGYFAPETAFDQTADQRSDIFSFCVVLWRALYGTPPFSTDSLDGYLRASSEGRLARPARRGPQWLHEVVRKGLHADPAKRYRSMNDLLHALDADPRRVRLAQGAAALALIVSGGVGFGAVQHRRSLEASCFAEAAAIDSIWDAASRQRVQGVADPLAPERTDRVLRGLDRYALQWKEEQRSSCEATWLKGTQPASVHEMRSACLLGTREQLEGAIDLLEDPDPAVQRRADETLASLSPPRLCGARDVDHAYAPLPADPAARVKALEGRRLAMRVDGLFAAGRVDQALASAERARALASEAGVAGDEARALRAIARTLGGSMRDSAAAEAAGTAFVVADRAGIDRDAGLAAALLACILADGLGRVDEGRRWIEVAQGKLDRLGGDDELELSWLQNGACVEGRAGNATRGAEQQQRALEKAIALYGADSDRVCHEMYVRGLILADVPDLAAAIASYRQAIECMTATTGPSHPPIGVAHAFLAVALFRQGELFEARQAAERALALRELQGDKDPIQGVALTVSAVIATEEERFVDAERDARRALSALEGTEGEIGEYVPTALYALGVARLSLGDAKDAQAQCARAQRVRERAGPLQPDHVYAGDFLRCLGDAQVALGDVQGARRDLERSVALPTRWNATDLLRARFALARALAAGPSPDTGRARQLATETRTALGQLVPALPWVKPRLDAIERWLAEASRR